MKYTELQNFIEKNNLLRFMRAAAGIYAITIDGYIAYIGESKNIYERCGQHIYKTENATLINEPKYLLLLSAKLGGHRIDCSPIEYCSEAQLRDRERYYIEKYEPSLNIQLAHSREEVCSLKIEELLEKLVYHIDEVKGK